jgi:Protein of unknown function (DUF732)
MSQHRRISWAVPLVAAAAALFGSTAVATADATDDAFVAHLHVINFQATQSNQDLVSIAHSVCSSLNGGTSESSVVSQIASNNGLSNDRAQEFVTAAAQYYCPGFAR